MDRADVMKHCYQIPGQCWPTELGWLYDTMSRSHAHAEVGVYCGRSLFASCRGMSEYADVVGVDDDSAEWVVDRPWITSVRQATYRSLHLQVKHLSMHSVDAVRFCQENRMTFESVYIDGCHEYAECLADIQGWMTLVRPGGIICGHDYWPVHTGVVEAVNEAFGGEHSVVPGTRIWFKEL